jgi:hypothetical protein
VTQPEKSGQRNSSSPVEHEGCRYPADFLGPARGKFVVTRGGVEYDARVSDPNRSIRSSFELKFIADAEARIIVTFTEMNNQALFARTTFLGILTAIFAIAAPGQARAQSRKIELADLQKIVNVSSPEISPDGKSIVIIVSRVNWDEDRYDSQLVLVDTATGAQRPLTNIRKGLSSPQWSPSGDRLASVAEAGEEKKAAAQIFVLPMNGGEPQQITSAPLGVEQFAWRPDGAFIAFGSPDEPPNKADIEKHHDLFEVGDNSFLDTSAPTPSWSPPQGARRSGSRPARGACRRTTTILYRRFLGRQTANRSASRARPTRTAAIPIKPWWRSWTSTAGKFVN